MIVYRIAHTNYANNISGESASKQKENRWNSFGTPMLYTAESPALCAVELHQYLPPFYFPKDYSLITIELPETEILQIEDDFFEDGSWIDHQFATQSIGDYFIQSNEYLVLKVPSAMITNCWNYLINPKHKAFKKVKIKEISTFPMEGKLFQK